jgi:class 3 adenylate cyclase
MEDLDPEEAGAVVDPALKLMIDAVHRYDGYLVQSTGDGIFALFGAPVAHEDHPQRALFERERRRLLYAHYHLPQLADLCVRARLARRGLKAVDEALSFAESSGVRYNLAELWRLRGELLLLPQTREEVQAVNAIERAIEIARRQQAKLFELRATASLSRFLQTKRRVSEAHEMLSEIYGWFTEGFDTPDLKEARALLDDLTLSANQSK